MQDHEHEAQLSDYFNCRKSAKKEKKYLQDRDRTKFKKTDLKKYQQTISDKQLEVASKHECQEGRVTSILPQGIMLNYTGKSILAVLKGVLKKERTHAKNLVAVGDKVLFEIVEEGFAIITQVLPRSSFLSRADNLSRRKEQLIAVNIDQVLITASVINPPLKPALIDRYIIAAEKGGMKPVIVINKMDLLEGDESEEIEIERYKISELKKVYREIGIEFCLVSTEKNDGIDRLKAKMINKTSVYSGQSGVGKSSLINATVGLDLRVNPTVERTKKGAHTTTYTSLIPLREGGWCVDTPGIKSFGVWDLKAEEIESYYTEINAIGRECKFQNCTHTHEELCAVKTALEEDKISFIRYDSYISLRSSILEKHQRR